MRRINTNISSRCLVYQTNELIKPSFKAMHLIALELAKCPDLIYSKMCLINGLSLPLSLSPPHIFNLFILNLIETQIVLPSLSFQM